MIEPRLAPYPNNTVERSRWIVDLRGPRSKVNSREPSHYFVENERTASGEVARVATIFLTNRECPWKCVMCDLWQHTTEKGGSPGDTAEQVRFALKRLPSAKVLKIYNSGSFFDLGAVTESDCAEIAEMGSRFERMILECHPKLVGERAIQFSKTLKTKLEIAMGLETAHPAALEKINKRITLEDYASAVKTCKEAGIDVRTFLLVNPPFIAKEEQVSWLRISIRKAFELGSDVVSLIPARKGNGALEELSRQGEFEEPSLSALEEGLGFGISLKAGTVLADLWDLEQFSRCEQCFHARKQRLEEMNLSQRLNTKGKCLACGE
jgi:radical SAM enzyme (TIGR01210 family)